MNDLSDYSRLVIEKVQTTRARLTSTWMMFFYPVFTACHPDTAKILLKSSEPKSKYSMGAPYRMILPWLGDGLLLSDGKKWERNRRLLTPAFHFDILKPYVQIYNDVTEIFLDKLQKACDSRENIEIYSHVSLATLDNMLRCSLSYEGHVQEMGDSHPYVRAVRKLGSLSLRRILSPWLFPDFLFWLSPTGREYKRNMDYVHDFADGIIASRREIVEKNPGQLQKNKLDFLDILITAKDENGEGLSDLDIRAEVDTFLFEGHDTTASGISWAIFCLAKYPEEQEKIYKEVTSVLDGRSQLSWDDMSRLKYTTVFLKEVMRMHSTVPLISRWLTKPLVLDGVEIPSNLYVDILIHCINHHPDVWPDHMEFRPSRFEDYKNHDRDPYTYVPFSAGPRNCIGQNFALNEERVMIGALVERFKVELVEGHVYEEYPEVVMRPKYGIKIKINDVSDYIRLVTDKIQTSGTKMTSAWMMFFFPVFTVCHPDTAKVLFKSSEPKPKYSLGGSYRMLLPWLGDGLLISDGKKWERNRRLLTPAFHFDILKPYVQIYNDVTEIFLEKLQKACNSGKSIEIYSQVSLATLDTMLRCSLSYEGHVQEKGDSHPYVQAVRRLGFLSIRRLMNLLLHPNFLFWLSPTGREYKQHNDYVHEFADEIITSRRKSLEKDPNQLQKSKLDFLDILITAKDENGEGLSDLDIRAEVDTFLFEGHDTTASAISWAIYCLAKYPEEQEKIYKEVTSVLDGRSQLSWEDMSRLKYTTMFLKEVMRMHSPVPFISRWLTKPMILDGVEIPENVTVDIFIHCINHHPDVWPDHMEFRPSRFEDYKSQDKDPYTYVPFSAGSRNCIGQNFALNEERVMIGALVKRFKVELVEGHVYEEYPEVVMRAKYGIKINVKQR